MRKRFTILLFLFVPLLYVWSSDCVAQSGALGRISSCIERGSSNCLSPYLNSRIEITINNTRRVYAPGQAKFVLQQFFDSHPPMSFSIKHSGMRTGSRFALAEYRSSKGTYEVNLFLKQSQNGSFVIEKMRFARK
ncbi:MAG: DUF4783 domain-containing protein [Bacteroidota bacterium]